MKNYFLAALFFYSCHLFAQPSLIWQHCTGGTDLDEGTFVIETHDHGFIVVAGVYSNDGDILNNHGEQDVLLIRLDSNNNQLWQKTYGGSLDEGPSCILETSDHGFVFVAGTESHDGDVTMNHGDNDIWVVKIDSIGDIQWQKTFGDSTYDEGISIIQNAAGNFVVLGWLSDADWDADFCLLNLDPSGNLVWQKTYGGSDTDWGYQVIQTLDGGYMLSGWTLSTDGDVTGNHGEEDAWLIKTDGSGNMQWQRTYGGSYLDELTNVVQLPSGAYVFASISESDDGDVQGNFSLSEQFWVVKIDATGNIVAQKCYGGTGWDEPYRILLTPDQGFVIAGMTASNDSDVTGNHGDFDCWTLKLDSNLDKQWAVCSGGSDEDLAYGICSLSNGDYVLTGYVYSNDGDVSGNHAGGYTDVWTFRLSGNANGIDENEQAGAMQLYPQPAHEVMNVRYHSNVPGSATITISDLSGRNLLNENINSRRGLNNFKVSLDQFKPGAYLFTLKTDEGLTSKRLLKD